MSAISSINFKKSNAIQTRHNDRDLPPNYLISDTGCEVNRTHKEALKLRNEIIENAINAYNKNKSPKAPNFKAKSYEWSAVVNIKSDTNMQDLERLAEHFEKKYGFQCYQIAIHRDEGYIENGEKHINHHAHLEFITLDKNTGKNMYRRELISPKILRQIQTEVAEILNMERGQDKRISKRERIEPRKYAQLKEQEKKAQKELKAELEQEKLSTKEIKAYIEQFRKNCTGKDLPKEFFRDISNLKKQAEPTTKEFLDDTLNSLLQNYLKEKEKNIKLENEILSKQELEIEFQTIIKRHEAEIEKLKQQKLELEAKLKEFNLEQEQKEKSPAQIDLNFINKIENTRFMDNKDDIYSLYSTLGKYGLIDQQKYLETKLREPKISTPNDYIRDVKEKILATIEQDKNKAIDTERNRLIQENKGLREENAELIRQNNFYKNSRSNKNQQQQNNKSQQQGWSR